MHWERARVRHEDRVFRADLFAHRTADARLGIDESCNALEGPIVQLQAAKGADLDAEVAPGAKLVDDLGLWPVGTTLDPLRSDALGVFDALDGAYERTSAAVDAYRGIDVMKLFVLTGDRFDRAHFCTCRTADTVFRNQMGHDTASVSIKRVLL